MNALRLRKLFDPFIMSNRSSLKVKRGSRSHSRRVTATSATPSATSVLSFDAASACAQTTSGPIQSQYSVKRTVINSAPTNPTSRPRKQRQKQRQRQQGTVSGSRPGIAFSSDGSDSVATPGPSPAAAAATALVVNSDNSIVLERSGKVINIEWHGLLPTAEVKASSERKLSFVLTRRGEYTNSENIPEYRVKEIERVALKEGVALEQALCLRKQILVNKIIWNASQLSKKKSFSVTSYEAGMGIDELSQNTDLPAVAILRTVFTERLEKYYTNIGVKTSKSIIKWAFRYNGILPSQKPKDGSPFPDNASEISILRGEEFGIYIMTSRDVAQLSIAKGIDQISYEENWELVKEKSTDWENSLYTFLDSQHVAYYKEAELMKLNSKVTPEVVFIDDCYINGTLVRWMDCKAFYGSNQSGLFLKKLTKQLTRYNAALGGNGAIVYKRGYSEQLKLNLWSNVLLLDKGPLTMAQAGDDDENTPLKKTRMEGK
jgi:hypothetical protein